jgi:hypothetical protein
MRLVLVLLLLTVAPPVDAKTANAYEYLTLSACKEEPSSEACQKVCNFTESAHPLCHKFCEDPETLTLEECKGLPIVERFKDADAEKLINKGKIISTDTKGRRTILFLKYKSKIYSCTLSTQSNSTTMCERSISR